MNILEFSLVLATASVAAGFLGALTGLGGGVVIVPLLSLVFGVDIRYAVGASLVSVIATSSGAAAAYVREGLSNIRVGMLLELATTLGAIVGAYAAGFLSVSVIAVVFGVVLILGALLAARRPPQDRGSGQPDRIATRLRLDSAYPTGDGYRSYHVRGVPLGLALMWIAGALSGLLGIGSGAMKVLAMDRAMRLPFKVSTTTSNFMIGVTAAASAGVYLRRGYIDPGLAMPVVLGIITGAALGARALSGAPPRLMRLVFAVVVTGLGLEMIWNGVRGQL